MIASPLSYSAIPSQHRNKLCLLRLGAIVDPQGRSKTVAQNTSKLCVGSDVNTLPISIGLGSVSSDNSIAPLAGISYPIQDLNLTPYSHHKTT